MLNRSSGSPQLAATTRLQWLQCNPLGQLWLSNLHELKCFCHSQDYLLELIVVEKDPFWAQVSFGDLEILQTELWQLLPHLDCHSQLNLQPWLWSSCWQFLPGKLQAPLFNSDTFPPSSSCNNSPLVRFQIESEKAANLVQKIASLHCNTAFKTKKIWHLWRTNFPVCRTNDGVSEFWCLI